MRSTAETELVLAQRMYSLHCMREGQCASRSSGPSKVTAARHQGWYSPSLCIREGLPIIANARPYHRRSDDIAGRSRV